jgi:hypothetical protein
MAYSAPAGDAVHFQFTGDAYSAPAGDAVAFTYAPIPQAAVVAVVGITADVATSFTEPAYEATVAAALPLVADVQVATGFLSTVTAAVPLVANVQAQVPRYILQGVVKDGDALVDRRVRVYLRSTGALVVQGDTTNGAFSFVMGDAPDEYVIMPIDLSAGATDWAPPTANRVLSVLLTD